MALRKCNFSGRCDVHKSQILSIVFAPGINLLLMAFMFVDFINVTNRDWISWKSEYRHNITWKCLSSVAKIFTNAERPTNGTETKYAHCSALKCRVILTNRSLDCFIHDYSLSEVLQNYSYAFCSPRNCRISFFPSNVIFNCYFCLLNQPPLIEQSKAF